MSITVVNLQPYMPHFIHDFRSISSWPPVPSVPSTERYSFFQQRKIKLLICHFQAFRPLSDNNNKNSSSNSSNNNKEPMCSDAQLPCGLLSAAAVHDATAAALSNHNHNHN